MAPIIDPSEEKTIVKPSNVVRAFQLGDELLLYSKASGDLFRANPMAALIWNGLNDGLAWQELVDLLCALYGLPEDRVSSDLDEISALWQINGLAAKEHPPSRTPEGEPHGPSPRLAYPHLLPEQVPDSIQTGYRLLDDRIALRLPDEQVALLVHPILAHLAIGDAGIPNITLDVRRGADHFVLLGDGVPIDWCSDELGVAPMIHANLHLMAYERGSHLTGIHAAAVVYNGSCILMPAVCGSGKSTLTAALVGAGFTYCSDDMVFLTPRPVRMRPAPMALGIKSGSWQILEKYVPQLDALICHERADGKLVRYLPPPPQSYVKNPTEALAVTHILFPGYRRSEKATLTQLSPAEGLCRITRAGYDVQGGITEHCVEQLIEWIAGIPCYAFRYGDLDEAVDCIQAFVG